MKVKELIEKLSTMPQDSTVYLSPPSSIGMDEVTEVKIDFEQDVILE